MSGAAAVGLLSEITDARTGCANLVTDAAFAAGRHAGHYATVCDRRVLAASLTMPERARCEECALRVRRAAR